MTDYLADLDGQHLWDSVPDAMLLVAQSGEILLANSEASRLFGFRESMTGVSVETLVSTRAGVDHRSLRADFHSAPRRRAMGAGMRLEARRADGSTFPVQISLSPLGPELAIAAVRDVSDMVASEELLVDSARRRILAEDHERIAKDMHDNVIQELFALGMSLQAAVPSIADESTASRVENAVSSLDEVILSIRSLIFDVRGVRSHQDGLRSRVVEVATSLIPSLGFEPSVSFDGPVDSVPESVQAHVVAVAREAMTNVARHAGASAAAVSVQCRNGVVTVLVTDDGVGMPAEPTRRSGHTNLAARAREVEGAFVVDTHPDGGTSVSWSGPIG
ncbi:MAG: two-component system sensor histidine kinase DevS [Candidatus Aldehydirespiratoraceae bacterium]